MTPPKTAKKFLKIIVNTINTECCENDYPKEK